MLKDNENLWKYSRVKEVKEAWQLNAIPDSMFDSLLKNKINIVIESTDKIGI